jgi:hypothetical protein
MRGRRDELSLEYYYFTIEALKEYFKISPDELENPIPTSREGNAFILSYTFQKN